MTRNISFVEGEFYHIYNRGVDKRIVFSDAYDIKRFLQSMEEFNTLRPIGSIYENSFVQKSKLSSSTAKLVNVVCFCLNPNHFHLLLEQVAKKGIEKFMHRLSGGFTQHFNFRNQRSGSLFQGRYKAKHIDSNEYLLHVSAYINLNNRVHKLSSSTAKSSWNEYVEKEKGLCAKNIVLDQFKNPKDYKQFALDSLIYMQERKQQDSTFAELLLD